MTQAASGTFTHHVLRFLRTTKILYFKNCAAAFGWSTSSPPAELFAPLQRIRLLVKAMREMSAALRPPSSWERRFAAYRLPFVPAQADDLGSIWRQAGLNPEEVWPEWNRLVPVATARHKGGSSVTESWAQASADFPEWQQARRAVNLFLAFSASSAVTERTLRELSRQETSQRARMLNSTEENILLASQAPTEDQIAIRTEDSFGNSRLRPKNKYLPWLLKAYINEFGMSINHKAPKRRRDYGLRKDPAVLEAQRKARGAPAPEAAPCHMEPACWFW